MQLPHPEPLAIFIAPPKGAAEQSRQREFLSALESLFTSTADDHEQMRRAAVRNPKLFPTVERAEKAREGMRQIIDATRKQIEGQSK